MPIFAKLSILFAIIFAIGYLLSWYMYKNKHKKFNGSSLQTKIVMWIPIYLVFVVYIKFGLVVRIFITLFLIIGIVFDYIRAPRKHPSLAITYAVSVIIGVISFMPIAYINKNVALAIGFTSVLSDVMAFFMGNFIGKHHLPTKLNNNKSWEGVLGQVLGALFGVILLNLFVLQVPYWLFVVVGIGSAVGDLTNSYIKRQEGIKDWGNSIAGHGGYLDRFSSLSYACIFSLFFIIFT